MAIPAEISLIFTGINQNSSARLVNPIASISSPLPATVTGTLAQILSSSFAVVNIIGTSTNRRNQGIRVSSNSIVIKDITLPQYGNTVGIRLLRHEIARAYPEAAAPAAGGGGVNTTGKPRYKVISPVQQGYYTEAVRTLNERQISDMRARGFQVNQVGGNFALMPAIRIKAGLHSTPSPSKKSRRGFVEGVQYNRQFAPASRHFIHRSERNPRLLFAEPQRLFMVDMYSLTVKKHNVFYAIFQPVTIARIRALKRAHPTSAGYSSVIRRISSTSGKSTVTTNPVVGNGKPTYTYNRGDPAKVQESLQQNNEIQRLTQELKNQKAWIESINSRTSQQLIDLGGATGDRQRQIDAQNQRYEELNKRISDQLIALGNAASDNQKAIAAANAARLVDEVKGGGGGGILGGIGEIFTGGGSSMIIIVMIIVLMVMMKR